jgi:hypothetical protein
LPEIRSVAASLSGTGRIVVCLKSGQATNFAAFSTPGRNSRISDLPLTWRRDARAAKAVQARYLAPGGLFSYKSYGGQASARHRRERLSIEAKDGGRSQADWRHGLTVAVTRQSVAKADALAFF